MSRPRRSSPGAPARAGAGFRFRGDHGASGVEYALGAVLLVAVLVAGLQWVQKAGEGALDRQATNIGYSGSGGGVPSTTTTSSTSSTTSTTTVTPTTQAPTTTTTVTPTPTTQAPTTTTTAPPTTTTTTTPGPSWPQSGLQFTGVTSSSEGSSWRPKPTLSWVGPGSAEITWTTTVTYSDGSTGPGATGTNYVNQGSTTLDGGTGVYARTGKPSERVVSVVITITKISANTNPNGWNWQTFTVTGPTTTAYAP